MWVTGIKTYSLGLNLSMVVFQNLYSQSVKNTWVKKHGDIGRLLKLRKVTDRHTDKRIIISVNQNRI